MVISRQCCGSHGFVPLAKFLRKLPLKGALHPDSFGELSSGSESDALPVFVSPQEGLKEKDEIDRLPGQPDE